MPALGKGIATLVFLVPVVAAASAKAPVQSTSPSISKPGASLLEAWLRKAVDAHHAEQEKANRTHNVFDEANEVGDDVVDSDTVVDKEQSEEEEHQEQSDSSDNGSEDDSGNANTQVQEDSEDTLGSENHSEEPMGSGEDTEGIAADETVDSSESEDGSELNSEEVTGSGEDSEGMNFVQKPYDVKNPSSQWRLLKSQLATKARRHKRNSEKDQRSAIYQLQSAAADLEKSVQKYMAEDDDEAETEQKAQRDRAEQTQKMELEVDQELSEKKASENAPAPAEEAPAKEAPAEEAPAEEAPVKEAPVKEAAAEEAPTKEVEDPRDMCTELCKHDTGIDADSCVTDCRSYVDAGGDVESLKDFVEDETYNEQGGETMEKEFEGMTGKKVADCEPSIDVDEVPTFNSVDTSGDGKIQRHELDEWSVKACVPDELSQQVFDVADTDFDEEVTGNEWNQLGENTKMENILDGFADKETKGEDQYEPTMLPEFHHVDTTGDGKLDKDEIMNMFKEEIQKRIPTMRASDVENLASQYEGDVMEDVESLDLDKDGELDEQEYGTVHEEGMGRELHEVAQNPNNLPDPDDLHREDVAGAAFLAVKA